MSIVSQSDCGYLLEKKKLDKLSCVHKILDFEIDLKKFEGENPNVNLKDALEMKD